VGFVEVGLEDLDLFYLARDRTQWLVRVYTIINRRVPYNAKISLLAEEVLTYDGLNSVGLTRLGYATAVDAQTDSLC
jgi:hypothetical protein